MASKMKAGPDDVLEGIRKICARLPDSTETITWGHPNWRVGGAKGKLFLGYGTDGNVTTLGFKAHPMLRDGLLQDPRFSVAPYVGKYGWLSMDLSSGKVDFGELEELIRTSWQEISAGALAKKGGAKARREAAKKPSTKTAQAKKAPSKKPAKRSKTPKVPKKPTRRA